MICEQEEPDTSLDGVDILLSRIVADWGGGVCSDDNEDGMLVMLAVVTVKVLLGLLTHVALMWRFLLLFCPCCCHRRQYFVLLLDL